MEATEALEYRKVSDFSRALSHPTRVEIVAELLKSEKCVGDIKDLAKLRQPNVSQHLSLLRLSGIVDCRNVGKRKCYFLKNPRMIKVILKALKG